jgi:hypothetical protein
MWYMQPRHRKRTTPTNRLGASAANQDSRRRVEQQQRSPAKWFLHRKRRPNGHVSLPFGQVTIMQCMFGVIEVVWMRIDIRCTRSMKSQNLYRIVLRLLENRSIGLFFPLEVVAPFCIRSSPTLSKHTHVARWKRWLGVWQDSQLTLKEHRAIRLKSEMNAMNWLRRLAGQIRWASRRSTAGRS